MTNEHIFESSFQTYKKCHASQLRVRTSDLRAPSKSSSPPSSLLGPSDYIVDFQMVGSAALAGLPGPLNLFRYLYLECGKYEKILRELRITLWTFDVWDSQVRETLGEAFRREGIWPSSRYLKCRARAHGRSPQFQHTHSAQTTSNLAMGGAL